MFRNKLFAAVLLMLFSGAAIAAADGVKVDAVVLRLLHEADAPAQRSGVLTKIHAREGDAVSKGDLLAELDQREAELAEQAARVEWEIAQRRAENDVQVRYASKANEVAAAELRRSEESIVSFPKSISRSQIDVERLEVEKTALEREQAEQDQRLLAMEVEVKKSAVSAARLERRLRQIVAPIDGVVVEAPARLGEWLEPGELAFRLVGIDRLKAEGFIAAADVARVTPGAEALVRLSADGDSALMGRVVFVSPEVDPINNQVRVWAEVENKNRLLRPGQHAEMTIQVSDSE
ncbi:Macrolide export protein MacA [Posidoniimonas polymericola]|uniref:Macrolide export protein MacA n=1 Tax=Posidoniimonas polymericola TaxID=2528002 RepID=A0A5C5YSL2_9BACT|nr:efflux RND transporter periplasmic adaptor subunit [Posidoniimonas polymericola]TWT77627.1 Macrolide export protein MacA [Posidoniimonas polymericola]